MMIVSKYIKIPAFDEPVYVCEKECAECRNMELDGVEIKLSYYTVFLCDKCAEELITYMEVFYGNISSKNGKIRGDIPAANG